MILSWTSRRDAWGMKLPLFNPDDKYKGSPTDNFKYNGKEYMADLGYYEYGFRIYDPTTARFTAVDPLADTRNWVSPYNYVQNNPILRIDPNGAIDREAGEMLSDVEKSKRFHEMNGTNVISDCPTCPKNSSFDVYRNNDNLFTYAGQNDKGEDIVLNGNGDGPSISSFRTRVGALLSERRSGESSSDNTGMLLAMAGASAEVGGYALYNNDVLVKPQTPKWLSLKNGKGYRQGWGGNGATGARSISQSLGSKLGLLSKGVGFLGIGLTSYQYATNQTTATAAAADVGVGLISIYGGIYGASFGIGYEAGKRWGPSKWYGTNDSKYFE